MSLIPSCRDVALSVSSGELEAAPWPRRLLLRLHFLACYICRRYAAQIRFLGAAARQGQGARVDPKAVAALQERLKGRLGKP